MNNPDKADEYTELFIHFSERVEKGLKRGVFVLALLLLIAQAALAIPAVRHVLASADRHEGVPIFQTKTP